MLVWKFKFGVFGLFRAPKTYFHAKREFFLNPSCSQHLFIFPRFICLEIYLKFCILFVYNSELWDNSKLTSEKNIRIISPNLTFGSIHQIIWKYFVNHSEESSKSFRNIIQKIIVKISPHHLEIFSKSLGKYLWIIQKYSPNQSFGKNFQFIRKISLKNIQKTFSNIVKIFQELP